MREAEKNECEMKRGGDKSEQTEQAEEQWGRQKEGGGIKWKNERIG